MTMLRTRAPHIASEYVVNVVIPIGNEATIGRLAESDLCINDVSISRSGAAAHYTPPRPQPVTRPPKKYSRGARGEGRLEAIEVVHIPGFTWSSMRVSITTGSRS